MYKDVLNAYAVQKKKKNHNSQIMLLVINSFPVLFSIWKLKQHISLNSLNPKLTINII